MKIHSRLVSDRTTTRVLFNWQPSALDSATIHQEYFARLRKRGIGVSPALVFVRGPDWHRKSVRKDLETQVFHRDDNQVAIQFVLWANFFPTEVLLPDGAMLDVKDGDAILIDNLEVQHRVSAAAVACNNRWFAKAYLKSPTRKELGVGYRQGPPDPQPLRLLWKQTQ